MQIKNTARFGDWEIEVMRHMCHMITNISLYGHCQVWGKEYDQHESQVLFPCLRQGEDIEIDEELKKRNLIRLPYKNLD